MVPVAPVLNVITFAFTRTEFLLQGLHILEYATFSNNNNNNYYYYYWDRSSTLVKVLCYKSVVRWFDPSWCHWNFSFT